MSEERSGIGLSTSLLRVAADPRSVDSLHEILGGFCHKCRNTLNSMKLSLYLAERGSTPEASASLRELEPHYQAVEHLFDRLQAIFRPMALMPVELDLALLIAEHRPSWERWMGARGRRLELSPPEGPSVGEFDPHRLGQGLDALISWRAEAGPPELPARLRWGVHDQEFLLEWEERSAPGLVPTGDESGPSATLALPLLSRVIHAHGGRLDASLRDEFRIGLRWPLTIPKT